jgi:hypothetical protein
LDPGVVLRQTTPTKAVALKREERQQIKMRATKPQLPTVLNLGIKMQVTQRRNYKILTSFTEIITALIAPKSINALFYPFTDRLPRTTRTFHG